MSRRRGGRVGLVVAVGGARVHDKALGFGAARRDTRDTDVTAPDLDLDTRMAAPELCILQDFDCI